MCISQFTTDRSVYNALGQKVGLLLFADNRVLVVIKDGHVSRLVHGVPGYQW